MIKFVSVAFFAGLLSSVALAETFGLGVGGGAYFPSSSLLKGAFGDQWTSIGFSPSSSRSATGGRTDFDIQVLSKSSGGNRLFVFAPTFGYSQGFGNDRKGVVPYFAARIGPAYADYRIYSVTHRDTLINTNFELGATVGERFRLYGRYDGFTKRNGVDFSGFSVNAQWLFASF